MYGGKSFQLELLPSAFQIERGDRIAQLILEEDRSAVVVQSVSSLAQLTTKRGANGFGSTGLRPLCEQSS